MLLICFQSKSPRTKMAANSSSSSPLRVQVIRSQRGHGPSVGSKGSALGKRARSQVDHDSPISANTASESVDINGNLSLNDLEAVEVSTFTPRRYLQRTPPLAARTLTEKKEGVQDVCFTPTRSLQRTPPLSRTRDAAGKDKGVQKSVTPRRSGRQATASRELNEVVDSEQKRGTQASCFYS